jgi:iron complex transport system permease protein
LQRLSIQKSSISKRTIAYLFVTSFSIFAFLASVSIGTFQIPVLSILDILAHALFHTELHETTNPMMENIVLDIRLPRVMLAGLVGASLALAGAAFQGLLQNPLADPYTLGISSGASLGAVFVLFFGIQLPLLGNMTLPLVSIFTGFLTIVAVLMFSRFVERSMKMETIILTGIIMSSFLGSIISLMIALTGEELRQIIHWLLGSVSMRGWDYIYLFLPFFLIGTILLIFHGNELNALSFGEEKAHYLGVDVRKKKLSILIAASILTGAAVAVSGTIGFVGLVIPHLNRLLWGPDHRDLLPLSLLFGAGFLILADLVSRTIISPTELPIGVITALIGAPIFALILTRQRLERRG